MVNIVSRCLHTHMHTHTHPQENTPMMRDPAETSEFCIKKIEGSRYYQGRRTGEPKLGGRRAHGVPRCRSLGEGVGALRMCRWLN